MVACIIIRWKLRYKLWEFYLCLPYIYFEKSCYHKCYIDFILFVSFFSFRHVDQFSGIFWQIGGFYWNYSGFLILSGGRSVV